ncbi:MAG: NAD(P)H-dependent oxidoreductase [Methylocella sp.]
MLKVAIIIGSTRPGRKAEAVARWVYDIASKRSDAAFEIVDIKDFNLPLLDEPVPAAMRQYSQPHTKAWAAKIEQFDAFVFVTPEYNHGPSAALKNAIDFLHREWNNKAVGFVGYGGNGGARSVEILRQVVSNVELADVRAQVGLSLFTDFENFTTFKPGPHLEHHRHARSGHRLGWRLEAPSHAEERLASVTAQ